MIRGSQSMLAFPDLVPARVVLYMLSFSGFTVSFMMRNDINIAMVAMVKPPSTTSDTNVTVTSQYCYVTPNTPFTNNSTPIRLEVVSLWVNEKSFIVWILEPLGATRMSF